MKDKKGNTFIGIVVVLFFVILIFIAILSFSLMIDNKEEVQVSNEKYDVDYKVYLKDNNYYQEKFLDKGRNYVTSIIDYINADFLYHYYLGSNDKLSYTYRIDANIVISEQGNIIYDKNYKLLDEREETADGEFDIDEGIKLDYNKYNELAKDFVNEYGISNLTSVLNVKMHVKVNNHYEDTVVMSMPLDVKTISVNLSNSPKGENQKFIKQENDNTKNIIYIILYSILEIILVVTLVVYLIVNKRNNAEYLYNKEINKIKNKYGAYIQEVYYTFDLTGYKMIRVRDFVNLLDIMDIINSPILMIENSKKNGCFFIVLTNTNFIYVYGIKIEEIEKKIMNKKAIK